MPVRMVDRNGTEFIGRIVYSYSAFEGGMRYIIQANNKEYRCFKADDTHYVEYIA